ncbi:MAG TPA: dihydroxyacetone kinase subunit DhaL [Candidatus Methylacidiphilales bacterium]|jgi:dihydroxyacetone kinase phosphoprotein-dependent L subunit|nr:dihydroxyacetone kinase subunit DhaL [Candidatus Methylacidiphilales bacterium]
MKTIPFSDIERAVQVIAETAIANEAYFSELDGECGDGDFGTSLATGFRVVQKEWPDIDRTSVGTFLGKIGVIITSNVGGCSGPLWGTAFLRASGLTREKQEIALADLAQMLRRAIEGMMARGNSQLGDKTILDALDPVAKLVEERAASADPTPDAKLLFQCREAAEAAAEKTRPWTAKRGRQAFTCERSAGTLDPGVVAVGVLLKALSDAFQPAAKL